MKTGAKTGNKPGARVLYLSYDGMCDPLGGSQVLPYLFGLSRLGHRISLISFEKGERSVADRRRVQQACEAAGIDWHPLPYHKRPPLISSVYDVLGMRRMATRLHKEKHFDIAHCRSYIPALVGLRLKRRHGVRFLFDMRGFWADERIEGRLWNASNPLFKAAYNFFKKREEDYLAEADHIVTLTDDAKNILLDWRGKKEGPPITVIPCCVDFDAFPAIQPADRRAARERLGIRPDAKVATYLGSVGSSYMIGEMLDFFCVQLDRDASSVFLILTRDAPDQIVALARERSIPEDRLSIRAASRAEVPVLTAAADYALFFIEPVFSKRASSPTKLGEFLSLELPIITNGGVGDVSKVIGETGAGVVVEDFSRKSYERALDSLAALRPDMDRWRRVSRELLDVRTGIERFSNAYSTMTGAR